ncbi:MAG TPA: glycosyltransferase, partial [Ignavibacteriaceae bacterium]
MRVLLLADAYSSHTIKWANSLAENGLEVYLYSLSPYDAKFYNDRVKIYQGRNYRVNNFEEGSYFKIIYLSSYFNLKELIEKIKPDILHAHYASSYGFLGSIMNYHP